MAQVLLLHPLQAYQPKGFVALLPSARRSSVWTPRSITVTPLVAWFDPTDITTLFTDTAGTVPVTADGDLVACMKDKSGNNNHATQSVSGSRPIYRSGGYLDFDGARFLVTAAIQITGTGQHSSALAVNFTNNTGVQSVLDADNQSANPRLSQLLRNNAGTAETIAFNTVPTAFTDGGGTITAATNTVLSEITGASSTEAFINGIGNGSTAVTGTLQSGAVVLTIGCTNFSSPAQFFTGKYYGSANYQGALSTSDHAQLVAYLTAKMAVVSHDTTGALTGPGSAVAGTAVYNAVHPSSGVLTGPGSTIAGTAARTREHATSGIVTGPGSSVAGTSVHNIPHATSGAIVGPDSTIVGAAVYNASHPTSGTLTGQPSAVSGSATRFRAFATSGILTGPDSSIVGTSARFRALATSGVLVGQGSTVTGSADHPTVVASHDTTGVLTGSGSTITGTAARFRVFATSGILVGTGSAISGAADRRTGHWATGALTGPVGTVSGSVARFRTFAVTGALQGPGAVITGAALIHNHHATGALVGQDAIILGTAARTRNHVVSGALLGQPSSVAGNASRWRDHYTSGDLAGGVSALFGSVFNGIPQLHDIPVDGENLSAESAPGAGTLQSVAVASGQIVNHPPYPAA